MPSRDHAAPKRPAIFLDRDGVLIENREDYHRSLQEVSVFPQALEALAKANQSPYAFVIVTNQSAIGRGLITPARADAINLRVVAEIEEAGGRIDGVFMCPHTPEDNCECRKPKPGLILQAARSLFLNVERSILVGDALSDIEAARLAGIQRAALVLTGRGAAQVRLPEANDLGHFHTFTDLATALEVLLGPDQLMEVPGI